MDLLHANSITFENKGLLLLGPSGSGKSDLCIRLIDKGWTLISDDYSNVWVKAGEMWAKPHENTSGKIEVRGLGIVDVPFCPKTQIMGLIYLVESSKEVERMPEIPLKLLMNVTLPYLNLYAFEDSTPLKIKYFLEMIIGNTS